MTRPMHVLPKLAPLVLAVVVCAVACKSKPEPVLPLTVPVGPALTIAPAWSPPSDWAAMGLAEFEELVLENLPQDRITLLTPDALRELALALDRMDESSVRAAVILGRSSSDQAADVLWNRLKRRVLGPQRNSDAADLVAAAALGRFPRPERFWRIVRLVDGPHPHPDLEVRVECACTALAAGFDRVIPFLLKVLRIGTWIGRDDERDFPVSDTTAWARSRAAEALSARAGVPVTYRADAPIEDREKEIRALEERLQKILEETAAAEKARDNQEN